VGRTIVSKQEPTSIRPPVRGIRKVKALLIANPSGDVNLHATELEVMHLADAMRRHPTAFSEPDVLIGPEQCQQIRLLNTLSSGKYGLVHYSGHAFGFAGEQSAWLVADNEKITAHQLTSAVEMAPPALMFSSSVGGRAGQVFDLPVALLQAGVEAYIGALWEIEFTAARLFSEEFYKAFLIGKHSLGECLRRAKWARKQHEEAEGKINWLAFILHGNPRATPADLFPAMRR
jgi:CHAT domain-containing protein